MEDAKTRLDYALERLELSASRLAEQGKIAAVVADDVKRLEEDRARYLSDYDQLIIREQELQGLTHELSSVLQTAINDVRGALDKE